MPHVCFCAESNNSLAETLGAVDLAAAIGVMNSEDAGVIQQFGTRLRMMLTKLLHTAQRAK